MKGKSKDYNKRRQKWEEKSREYKITASREATFDLTVRNTIKLLGDRKEGRVLDIGCGFGEIDILLAQKTDFEISGCDISETVVKSAQNNVSQAGFSDRIKIEEGDVYNLKYPDNSFDMVLSFGYVSAATYEGVQKEISRVLKPKGILICDFINCLSVYKFLDTIKRALVFRKVPYFVSLSGILREFEKEGFSFEKQLFFNTYPPINFKATSENFITFEDTIGKIFNTLLGRVRLVKFIKVKQ